MPGIGELGACHGRKDRVGNACFVLPGREELPQSREEFRRGTAPAGQLAVLVDEREQITLS